jgi:predicted DNA-binding transcriptional regulator AlpA
MEKLMTRKQAAEYLGFAPQTLARYAWLGKGPRFKKLGRLVRYTLEDLEAWIKAEGLTHGNREAQMPAVSLGPRVVIGGVAYYREDEVGRVLHQLGVEGAICWPAIA